MHQSIPAVPIPPPPGLIPRELAFFENELANAPPPGQKLIQMSSIGDGGIGPLCAETTTQKKCAETTTQKKTGLTGK